MRTITRIRADVQHEIISHAAGCVDAPFDTPAPESHSPPPSSPAPHPPHPPESDSSRFGTPLTSAFEVLPQTTRSADHGRQVRRHSGSYASIRVTTPR